MKSLKLVFYDSETKALFSKEMYLENEFYEQISDSFKLEKYEREFERLIEHSFHMLIEHIRYQVRHPNETKI